MWLPEPRRGAGLALIVIKLLTAEDPITLFQETFKNFNFEFVAYRVQSTEYRARRVQSSTLQVVQLTYCAQREIKLSKQIPGIIEI